MLKDVSEVDVEVGYPTTAVVQRQEGEEWFQQRRHEGNACFVWINPSLPSWREDLKVVCSATPELHDCGFTTIFCLSKNLGEVKRAELEAEIGVVLQFPLVLASDALVVHLQNFVDLGINPRTGPLPFVLATTPSRICHSWAYCAPRIPRVFRRYQSVLPSFADLIGSLKAELAHSQQNHHHSIAATPTAYATSSTQTVCKAAAGSVARCFEACVGSAAVVAGSAGTSSSSRRKTEMAKVSFMALPGSAADNEEG